MGLRDMIYEACWVGFVCRGNDLIHVVSLKCLFVCPECALGGWPGDHLRGDTQASL